MKSRQKNKQKDILFLIISSFIVVVAWIVFNIFHILATSTISEHIQFQLTPISGNFNEQALQQLKTRENVNPLFEQQATASQPATPTPKASLTPTPTSAPSLSITPGMSGIPSVATPGGTFDIQGQ